MPKYLYVVGGVKSAQSVCDLKIFQYKIIRESEKRWYVYRYAEEIYITKSRSFLFTDLQKAVAELRKVKERQLVESQNLVELLKQETSIPLIEVPYGGHLLQEGPVAL